MGKPPIEYTVLAYGDVIRNERSVGSSVREMTIKEEGGERYLHISAGPNDWSPGDARLAWGCEIGLGCRR